MLVELRVRDLGVIADLDLVIGPGMTALTGETGAGKTLVVEALELLLGGRAESAMVRAGATEATVEGRFLIGDKEVVLSRAVPTTGRSRAYVDGRMAPVAMLSEIGDELVDLHGQHVHQSLLRQAAQRDALDSFAGSDLAPVAEARGELAAIDARLEELGGDPRALARTVDLFRFQLDEIAKAAIKDPDEEGRLAAEESRLSQIGSLRTGLVAAREALAGSDASQAHGGLGGNDMLGASDLLGRAVAQLSAHESVSDLVAALRAAQADVEDVARELRLAEEQLEEDPARLEAIRGRIQLFAELRRKYGPSLADVLLFEQETRARLAELEATEVTRDALEERRRATTVRLEAAERRLGATRRKAAPLLAREIETHLQELALKGARLEVRIGDDRAGSGVEFLFAANPGEPVMALSKVASGGELSRAMLATRPGALGRPADARVRRGRRWRRWRGRPRRRSCAFGARFGPPGAGRDPPRPGGGVRRPAGARLKSRGRRSDRGSGPSRRGQRQGRRALPDALGPPRQRGGPQAREELLAMGARSVTGSGRSGNLA